jgi:hypothetical protein
VIPTGADRNTAAPPAPFVVGVARFESRAGALLTELGYATVA